MNTTKTLLFIFSFISLLNTSAKADGKLLRGEQWQRFSIEGKKADFYVAPNGNDSWSGMLDAPNSQKTDGPFATIERAQQAVRELKRKVYLPKNEPIEKRWIGSPHKYGQGKDILVLIRGGYYSLARPLTFTSKDGGERCETDLPSGAFEYHKLKDYYVTFAAYSGETPIISGGKKITNWHKENDKWVTVIKGIDVKKLVANGQAQTLARTPNSGYFTPPEFSKTIQEITFREGELKQWPEIGDNKVILLLRWHTGVNSINKIDEKAQVAYLEKSQPGVKVVPPRYYVENVKALLDSPGEWFFDKRSKKLSYIPPQDIIDPNNANIVAPTLNKLVIVKGKAGIPVRNLRFYGLHFEGTNPGGHAISFEYTHNCEIVDCNIRSIGGSAVYLAKGCYQNRILNNKIINADNGAILIIGNPHPQKWMDIICKNIISYNYIADCGGTNIRANNTLYTTISHNEITRTRGRTAISVGGWANLEEAIDGGYRVEYNRLHHVQKDADDSGAITTAGLTYDSIIRRNLIHDVKAGYFNDNVAFWFDNMSSGWLAEENIYYNLEQAEMKLCAANLVDNIYRNNFLIEPPENEPKGIIGGEARFEYSNIEFDFLQNHTSESFSTGDFLMASADVTNTGATGICDVDLYLDGKIVESKKLPVIQNNTRKVTFELRFHEPGDHEIAIGATPYKTICVHGEPLPVLYDDVQVSKSIVPVGENITVSAIVENMKDYEHTVDAHLYIDENKIDSKAIYLPPKYSKEVNFLIKPEVGIHTVRIGNAPVVTIEAYPHHPLEISKCELKTYCSGTAQPCDFKIDQKNNRFIIKAAGSDFFHAEDSYGAIYLQEKVKGNFAATVKIKRFGNRTHEWFRAGVFVRNDIAKSFDTKPGSLGSVLMFTTPGRAGIHWDEFGDGCMHKASSENLPENAPFPIWIKLERHGNSFSGYISYDGKIWTNAKYTGRIPGLTDSIDVGLAAGSCDQTPYFVEFEDFYIKAKGRK